MLSLTDELLNIILSVHVNWILLFINFLSSDHITGEIIFRLFVSHKVR